LNCDLIEHIESTPDTVITLVNNQKLTVLETADEILERIRAYRRSVFLAQYSTEPDPALKREAADRSRRG
jgi:flagellar protein FlbD